MRQKELNLPVIQGSALRAGRQTMALIIASACLLALPVNFQARSQPGQQKEKVVSKHPAPLNEPIEIIDVSVNTKAVKLGEGFEAETGWLKGVTFKVKNRSEKAITALTIDFDFPETKESAGAIMMHPLFLGQRPDFKSSIYRPPLHLQPNETIEISLEKEYAGIKTLIELKHPSVDVINKLVIRVGDMMFEDGTLYSGGFFYRRNPDPDSRQKWIQITEAQGTAGSN